MMNAEKLNKVIELLGNEKAKEAKSLFDKIDYEESVNYLMVKGKLEQKFQNWGDAINTFSKVVDLDPENVDAKSNLHLIQNILNFWNPEMFNP